jgi:hypothetical protein
MLEKQQARKDKQEQLRLKNANNKDMLVLKFVPADNYSSDHILTLASNPWLSFVAPLRPRPEDPKGQREKSINDIIRFLAHRWHVKKRHISLKLCK